MIRSVIKATVEQVSEREWLATVEHGSQVQVLAAESLPRLIARIGCAIQTAADARRELAA